MSQMTITEALSEVNLIKKKVQNKTAHVLGNLMRVTHIKDQYESEGGSQARNKAELQAIGDLNQRLIKIRAGISRANLDNLITINGETKSIHDWLIWKREISKIEIDLAKGIYDRTKNHFDTIAKQPQVYKDDEGKTHLVEYEANVNWTEFISLNEKLVEILDRLDGQLSLKNATIVIEV